MKIYSWNTYWHNKTLDKALRFIQETDADIICLQEVVPEFLERLRSLPYHVASSVHMGRHFLDGSNEAAYNVILSRYPILASTRVTLPDSGAPFRTRLLVRLMRPFGWGLIANERGFLYADIAAPGGTVRVFCVHLSLSGPSQRRLELEVVRQNLPVGLHALICGDFNIIDQPLLKLFNWFLGSSVFESMPWHRERTRSEMHFAETGFKNPLRGKVTHGFSRSQLDHILVPEDCVVLNAGVSTKKYGSDHNPVVVEIEL